VSGEEPAWLIAARQLAGEARRDDGRDERLATAARRRAARRAGGDPDADTPPTPAG
jgi:hypothetical protein